MAAIPLRRVLRQVPLVMIVTSVALFGQVSSAPKPGTSGTKTHAFDVVSIKPAAPGEGWHFSFTATGYSTAAMPIQFVLRQAFFPRNWNGTITGAPGWVDKQLFDIEAKVTVADLDEWQKERTQLAQPLIQQLLQNMLVERCKLAAHRVPSEAEGYAIVVDKHGARLKDAAADEARPENGQPLPGGGFVLPYHSGDIPHISFSGVTMSTFLEFLAGMHGGRVVDNTGLNGRYDFTLTWVSSGPDEKHEGGIASDDPDPLSHWNFGALGLKAQQTKLPTEDLVVDHIESPSQN